MVPKTPEHDQFCDPKCRKVSLYGKMACTKSGGIFHHLVVVRFVPELASQTRLLPNCLADVGLSRTDEGAGAKKIKNQNPEVQFSPILLILSPPSKNSNCHNFINIGG